MFTVYKNQIEKCYGCAACKDVCPTLAIEMKENEKGFLYPNINNSLCIMCKRCENVCIIDKEEASSIKKTYALKIYDKNVRQESQSGGAFFAMANQIIKNGGVVYGCVLDEKLEAIHIRADDINDVYKMRGSKYVQSNMENIFKTLIQDIKNKKTVLISGTSCQINAIKKRTEGLDCSKVIFVDLICHGVPSPKFWREHVMWLMRKLKGKIHKIAFRDKEFYSWGNHMEVVTYEKRNKIKFYHNRIFASLFYSNYILRDSCYECPFKNGNFSGDITIADFWGIETVTDKFADNKGVSLVLIHNTKAASFLKEIDGVEVMEIGGDEWMRFQMKQAALRPIDYDKFWTDYEQNGYDYIIKKYAGYNLLGQVKFYIKRCLNWLGIIAL